MRGVAQMGKTLTQVKVENYADIARQEDIRSIEVEALVDTGATVLCLPCKMIEELGLKEIGRRRVKTATGKNEIGVYGPVQITIQGRDCRVDVFELSDDVQPLIGYVPLELLDLQVDPKNGRLIPNPEHGGEMILDLL